MNQSSGVTLFGNATILQTLGLQGRIIATGPYRVAGFRFDGDETPPKPVM